jgi:hypothetical protein
MAPTATSHAQFLSYHQWINPAGGTYAASSNWSPSGLPDTGPGYAIAAGCVAAVWLIALSGAKSRAKRIIGEGLTEYQRVTNATLIAFGVIAIFCYLGQIEFARGYVALALPFGWALLICNRLAWRRILLRMRRDGRCLTGAIVVGSAIDVERTVNEHRQGSASHVVFDRPAPPCPNSAHDGLACRGADQSELGALEALVEAVHHRGVLGVHGRALDGAGPAGELVHVHLDLLADHHLPIRVPEVPVRLAHLHQPDALDDVDKRVGR